MSGKKKLLKRRRSKLFITSQQFQKKPNQFLKRVKSHGIAVVTVKDKPPLICLSIEDFNALDSGQASAELLEKHRAAWQRLVEKKLVPATPPKAVGFESLEQLTFPAYCTVHLNYFATGEGVTRGLYMLHARSADHLRKTLLTDWGDFFCKCCDIQNGIIRDPAYENLLPESVWTFLNTADAEGNLPANFIFSTKLYLNYS